MLFTPSFTYCDSLGHDIATYLEGTGEGAVGGAAGERIDGAIGGITGGALGELIGPESILPGAVAGKAVGTLLGGAAAITVANKVSDELNRKNT